MVLKFEEFQLDVRKRALKRGEELIPLKSKTLDVLIYLTSNAERLVTREELLDAVWPDAMVEESNLSQHIFLLRKALGEQSGENRCIITVPGRGYQFAAHVVRAPAEPVVSSRTRTAQPGEMVFQSVLTTAEMVVEDAVEDERQDRPPNLQRPHQRPSWLAAAIVAGALLAASIGSWLWTNRPRPVLRKVVLANFTNLTNETIFDDSLESGLRIELEQSPYIDLLAPAALAETLATMRKPPGTALTGDVAREVCERANYQVVLSGSIVRIGSQYLLTLEASNCATGTEVAAEKQTVANETEVLSAMDGLTRRMRTELGEPRRQVAGYDVPLENATTSSLQALRDYSYALVLSDRNDNNGARVLLRQAVALDPNFAQAWRRLGANYESSQEFGESVADYKRAFDLRDRTTEAERINIEISYYYGALHDYERAAGATRAAVAIYPDNEMMWGSLCNTYILMGRFPEAVDAGEHAIRIDPVRSLMRLAIAYKGDNRLDEAKRTAETALKAGKSPYILHSVLFQIAWFQQDQEGIREHGPWGLAHNHAAYSLDETGRAAATAGELRSAVSQLERGRTVADQLGQSDLADDLIYDEAEVLIDYGRNADAIRILQRLSKNADPTSRALQLAEAGNLGPARAYLSSPAARPNSATMHDYHWVPLLRAQMALAEHKPEEAIQDLEVARPYQLHGYEVPWLRAHAEAAAGQLPAAEADYRLILANPGVDSISPSYYLVHLELARVLVQQHKTDEARQQYGAMLAVWKNADPDLPQLAAARRELARLKLHLIDRRMNSEREGNLNIHSRGASEAGLQGQEAALPSQIDVRQEKANTSALFLVR